MRPPLCLTVTLVLALLGPLVGGCAPRQPVAAETATAAPAVAWPKTPCRGSVESFLGVGGLSLARRQTLTVREERLNGGQPGEQVGFWQLTGRPATCAKGDIALTVLPDCAIYSWRTSGGCRVAGLEVGH